jgi:colanic acid biosynthesis glycosyl transferase WcaI
MKIVFVNRYFYPDSSATSQLVSDLAFELAGSNRDVSVITSRQRVGDSKASLPRYEIIKGVEIHRVATTCFGRASLLGRALDYLTFYFSCAVNLLGVLSKGDVVVAKTDPPLISVVAMMITKMKGAKLVHWVQDLFPEVAEVLKTPKIPKILFFLLRFLRNISFKSSRRVVVIGEKMAVYLAGCGIPKKLICVIPNWSHREKIQPIESSLNSLKKQWGLEHKFVIGYAGNMGRAHEFETVLNAAKILKTDQQITFLFVGEGIHRAWLEKSVYEEGLKNVCFKPFQEHENLSQALSVPDIHLITLKSGLESFVVPSKFYGIAASGRPMIFIGESSCEIADWITRGDCGCVVKSGDGEGLAEAILSLLSDSGRLEKLGKNARVLNDNELNRSHRLREWACLLEEGLA